MGFAEPNDTQEDEAFLLSIIEAETEDEVMRSLVHGDLPQHTSLSKWQIKNLMRQHLRQIMGDDRFMSIASMGTKEGQKMAADLLETALIWVVFETENDLRKKKNCGDRGCFGCCSGQTYQGSSCTMEACPDPRC